MPEEKPKTKILTENEFNELTENIEEASKVPDQTEDIEELQEGIKDHAHKGIDTSRIRHQDIVRTLDSGCRVYNSASLNVANNTDVKIPFNTENFDIAGEYDNSTNFRFTVNKEGYYHISATISWVSGIDNQKYYIFIYKNGAVYSQGLTVTGPEQTGNTITDVIKLLKNDYIEIFAKAITGSGGDLQPGSEMQFFSIYKIY